MQKISIAIVLSLLVLVVIYAVVSNRDISIETPFASVTSSAPGAAAKDKAGAEEPGVPAAAEFAQPAAGVPAIVLLTKLTSIRPQEPGGEDSIYLKLGDATTDIWKMKAGESVLVNRAVEAGTTISLWERDGIRKDGDDDFLGSAKPQGPGGKLMFEQPETGDHLYTLSYEPES